MITNADQGILLASTWSGLWSVTGAGLTAIDTVAAAVWLGCPDPASPENR
jgi:hypothetical protein